MEYRKAFIYTLSDDAGSVHYVGQSWDVKTRMAAHQSAAKGRKNDLYRWLDDYKGVVIVAIVEVVKDVGWEKSVAERRWILKLRAEGHPIKNIYPRKSSPSGMGRFKFASDRDELIASSMSLSAQTSSAVREAVDILEKERG